MEWICYPFIVPGCEVSIYVFVLQNILINLMDMDESLFFDELLDFVV